MSNIINPNSCIPMYKQVLNVLNEKITRGEFRPGDKLPSEADLMRYFDVSRITVRAALSELVEDGILTRAQGKGTFVAPQKTNFPAMDLPGFNRSCILAGKRPSTKLLSFEWIYPTAKHMEFWNIQADEKILCSKRLRYIDNIPTMLEINYYPASFAYLMDEDLNQSLFTILQNHGYQFKVSERTVEICYPTTEECAILEVKAGTPLLLFKDVHHDLMDRPSFLTKQVYNPENMKFYL